MRIVEMGSLPEKEVVCKKCESILAYTEADIKHDSEELFGDFHTNSSVKCPVCGSKILLIVDGEPV